MAQASALKEVGGRDRRRNNIRTGGEEMASTNDKE